MDNLGTDRRVFVRVKHAADLVEGLESRRGLFVPTRLALRLGDAVILAVSLPESNRAIELPAQVTGRRLPRGAQRLLASGVVVRLNDPNHPMMGLLREVMAGRVVDLTARVQQAQRVHVRAQFANFDGLVQELRTLLGDELGVFPVDGVVYPRDRIAMTAGTESVPELLDLELEVRGLAHHDGRRAVHARIFQPSDRELVREFLNDLDAPPQFSRDRGGS